MKMKMMTMIILIKSKSLLRNKMMMQTMITCSRMTKKHSKEFSLKKKKIREKLHNHKIVSNSSRDKINNNSKRNMMNHLLEEISKAVIKISKVATKIGRAVIKISKEAIKINKEVIKINKEVTKINKVVEMVNINKITDAKINSNNRISMFRNINLKALRSQLKENKNSSKDLKKEKKVALINRDRVEVINQEAVVNTLKEEVEIEVLTVIPAVEEAEEELVEDIEMIISERKKIEIGTILQATLYKDMI